MLNRPGPTSFTDLRTIDGVEYLSFKNAAQKLGLLESDDIYIRAMQDASIDKSNFKHLQHYFAMIICHCQPSNPQNLFDLFLDDMNPPNAINDPNALPRSKERRKIEVLKNLEYFFHCMGTSCAYVL